MRNFYDPFRWRWTMKPTALFLLMAVTGCAGVDTAFQAVNLFDLAIKPISWIKPQWRDTGPQGKVEDWDTRSPAPGF